MKFSFLLLFILSLTLHAFAGDTTSIPISRQVFHEHITDEQNLIDKTDGHLDGMVRVGSNREVNLQVTDALIRQVNVLRNDIEENEAIPTNNDKVRYLRFLEYLLKHYAQGWKDHSLSPSIAPELVANFTDIFYANMQGESMVPFIRESSYDVGKINASIFSENEGYRQSQIELFKKFCTLHPDKILANLGPYVDEPFADSLVIVAFNNSPSQLYTYAQSTHSKQGKLIASMSDPRIKTVVELSKHNRALFYFPFLDDLIHGRKTMEEITKVSGATAAGYDSVGYYKLLVQTEIKYYGRVIKGDTPVAMYGSDGLQDMLQRKAIQHFVASINELHEMPDRIRFTALAPLNAQDLYYMMVLGENEIYTSSYKYSFDRMMAALGPEPHGDSLLISVNFDKFKKFIKMAAGYNKLDTFLRSMEPGNSQKLMQAFVLNLEKTNSLEDAVDVADSYGSITNPELQQSMLANVEWNLRRCIKAGNERGQLIYRLLKTIFLSADPKNGVDLSKEIGIPPIYTVSYDYLADDSGRVVQQVFFYGDKDGRMSYNSYLANFPSSRWNIIHKREWVEIKSTEGKPIWIFANKPLDNQSSADLDAQSHMADYMASLGLHPTVVIHRGHSYHLTNTIKHLPQNAKIIMLGSCGGYQNLSTILKYAPEAHIISTKQTGTMNVNRQVIEALDERLLTGKTIDWRNMWDGLNAQFSNAPASIRETFDDYIPPHKNLGALFIKAFKQSGGVVD